MTPLQKVAMGLVIVIVDPDVRGFDAVPDVLGWVLVLAGLFDLRSALNAFGALAALAVICTLVSAAEMVPAVPRLLDESGGWFLSLPQLVFSIILCSSIAALVDPAGTGVGRRLARLRWGFVALIPAPALLYGGGLERQEVLVALVGVAAVAANVYLIYLLFKVSQLPAAVATHP